MKKFSSRYFTDDLLKIIRQMLGNIICWPLNRGKNRTNNKLATAKRWPWPLNRGGRGIEVSNTAVYWQINRDFGKWLLNGGWPLNRWPLNRGRTVLILGQLVKTKARRTCYVTEKSWESFTLHSELRILPNFSNSQLRNTHFYVIFCKNIEAEYFKIHQKLRFWKNKFILCWKFVIQ